MNKIRLFTKVPRAGFKMVQYNALGEGGGGEKRRLKTYEEAHQKSLVLINNVTEQISA